MKRMIQFAALIVVAFLAGLPGAQALTCPLRAQVAPTACPMGVTEAGPDCPMMPGMGANECLRDCCNCGLPTLVGPIVIRVQPKLGAPVQLVALIQLNAGADRVVAAAPDPPTVSSSPPRYILHRVFRI